MDAEAEALASPEETQPAARSRNFILFFFIKKTQNKKASRQGPGLGACRLLAKPEPVGLLAGAQPAAPSHEGVVGLIQFFIYFFFLGLYFRVPLIHCFTWVYCYVAYQQFYVLKKKNTTNSPKSKFSTDQVNTELKGTNPSPRANQDHQNQSKF
jgi:hypothetical protein